MVAAPIDSKSEIATYKLGFPIKVSFHVNCTRTICLVLAICLSSSKDRSVRVLGIHLDDLSLNKHAVILFLLYFANVNAHLNY